MSSLGLSCLLELPASATSSRQLLLGLMVLSRHLKPSISRSNLNNNIIFTVGYLILLCHFYLLLFNYFFIYCNYKIQITYLLNFTIAIKISIGPVQLTGFKNWYIYVHTYTYTYTSNSTL